MGAGSGSHKRLYDHVGKKLEGEGQCGIGMESRIDHGKTSEVGGDKEARTVSGMAYEGRPRDKDSMKTLMKEDKEKETEDNS